MALDLVDKQERVGIDNAAQKDNNNRRPFALGNTTVLLTEEERKIFLLSLQRENDPNNTLRFTEDEQLGVPEVAMPAHCYEGDFDAIVSGSLLLMFNWSIFWTEGYLRKHLLAPLHGRSLSIRDGGRRVEILFDKDSTAQRAAYVCKAAAEACLETWRQRDEEYVTLEERPEPPKEICSDWQLEFEKDLCALDSDDLATVVNQPERQREKD